MNNDFEKIKIRKATENDIEFILYFIKALAEHVNKLSKVKVTTEELKKYLFGENPAAETILCFYEGEPIAFAIYFYMFSTFKGKPILYIEDLFVESKHRSKGIGKYLLKYLSDTAINKGCESMQWACLKWNNKASEFYESIGASKDDDNFFFELNKERMKTL